VRAEEADGLNVVPAARAAVAVFARQYPQKPLIMPSCPASVWKCAPTLFRGIAFTEFSLATLDKVGPAAGISLGKLSNQ
jgi:hypothetical protein